MKHIVTNVEFEDGTPTWGKDKITCNACNKSWYDILSLTNIEEEA